MAKARKTDKKVIDLRDDSDFDDLIQVADAAAAHYLLLRHSADALARVRALQEMCDALDLIKQLQAQQSARLEVDLRFPVGA